MYGFTLLRRCCCCRPAREWAFLQGFRPLCSGLNIATTTTTMMVRRCGTGPKTPTHSLTRAFLYGSCFLCRFYTQKPTTTAGCCLPTYDGAIDKFCLRAFFSCSHAAAAQTPSHSQAKTSLWAWYNSTTQFSLVPLKPSPHFSTTTSEAHRANVFNNEAKSSELPKFEFSFERRRAFVHSEGGVGVGANGCVSGRSFTHLLTHSVSSCPAPVPKGSIRWLCIIFLIYYYHSSYGVFLRMASPWRCPDLHLLGVCAFEWI